MRPFATIGLFLACQLGARAAGVSDAGRSHAPVERIQDADRVPARAWPAPWPASGVRVGAIGDAHGAVPERCPDHVECVRIANNRADVAHAACDAPCAECCPHASNDDCVRRECQGACAQCADRACRSAVCDDAWLRTCGERCRVEMSTCTGCLDAWCGEGAARTGCHRDVAAHHAATIAACDRDCPAGETKDDGACAISCRGPKKPRCSSSPAECTMGRSPDCRCECTGAAAGTCVTWEAVCVCD